MVTAAPGHLDIQEAQAPSTSQATQRNLIMRLRTLTIHLSQVSQLNIFISQGYPDKPYLLLSGPSRCTISFSAPRPPNGDRSLPVQKRRKALLA